MQVTADMVRELRERSGAGMMECKKALVETNGDLEAAFELLRKSGAAKAAKKAGRIAADCASVLATEPGGARVAMSEVNSETDFGAKDENFTRFAEAVARCVLEHRPADVAALSALPIAAGDETVEAARQQLVSKVGENIGVRRFTIVES